MSRNVVEDIANVELRPTFLDKAGVDLVPCQLIDDVLSLSLIHILLTTRPLMGKAEMPAAPVMGFSFLPSGRNRFNSLANSIKAKPKMTVKNGVIYGDALSAQEKKRIVMQKKKDRPCFLQTGCGPVHR